MALSPCNTHAKIVSNRQLKQISNEIQVRQVKDLVNGWWSQQRNQPIGGADMLDEAGEVVDVFYKAHALGGAGDRADMLGTGAGTFLWS